MIAIPVETDKLNTTLSHRFGRSKYFAIYNPVSKSTVFIENVYAEDKIRVAENITYLLSKTSVNKLVAYEIGLKMQNEASGKEIQILIIPENLKTLKQIIQLIKNL